jgi:hypothetical protein
VGPVYKTEINDRGNPLRWPRDTLYPQKLALTSPTSGGRSVAIVCSRTKATEFSFYTVGIATVYGLDLWGSISGRSKFLLYFTASIFALGPTQPPIQCVPGTLSPEVDRKRREADHSPPSSAEVKKDGAIPPLPRMSS